MGDLRHIEGALLDRLPAAVVVSDVERRIVYCNEAARELHDCEVGATLPAELALAVRRHAPWNGAISLDGSRIHCSTAPMRDGNRLIVGAITVSLPEGVLEDAELLAIGRRIARARAAARLTQQDLAEASASRADPFRATRPARSRPTVTSTGSPRCWTGLRHGSCSTAAISGGSCATR